MIGFISKGQVGINTTAPQTSSILDVNGGNNKGVLFPRVDIPAINNQAPISVSQTAKDGLLLYGKTLGGISLGSLLFWDPVAPKWNKMLYFKDTPKIAYIGLQNDITKLDNLNGGGREPLVPASTANNYYIASGYMPFIGFVQDTRTLPVSPTVTKNSWDIILSPGSYEMQVSLVFSAPAPDTGRGGPFDTASGYYTMGYFTDARFFPYDPVAGFTTTVNPPNNRTETLAISKLNENHAVTFLYSFELPTMSAVELYIGRMSGGSHYDLVNLISGSSNIKITKLK
ncbi:hypothetical protein [Chryseobacterium joostei]|uniref:hypothetical protein n=1 Tax=Chryseobacterium joostei TaxID=112234 RepID=UPI003D0DD2C7